MIPLVDIHCHVLPAMDDGPRSWDDSISMCRIAWDDGVRALAATVHQSELWRDVTRDLILEFTNELSQRLHREGIPIALYPCAEVMICPSLEEDLRANRLLTVADGNHYLLMELPSNCFFDLRELVSRLVMQGVRPILAHPERHPELLYGDDIIDGLIHQGCLVQVSANSITQGKGCALTQGVRRWAERGIIHLIGSDGHSPRSRPPGVSAAYKILVEWCGAGPADRICSTNGMAVLEGLPLITPPLTSIRRGWFGQGRMIGGLR